MAEKDEQKAVVDWFRHQYPKYFDLLTASLNGAFLHGNQGQRMRQAVELKKQGMKPGEHDLFLYLPRGIYHGLSLEMKDRGKKISSLTDSQHDRAALLQSVGYFAAWAPGAEAACQIIKNYINLGGFFCENIKK